MQREIDDPLTRSVTKTGSVFRDSQLARFCPVTWWPNDVIYTSESSECLPKVKCFAVEFSSRLSCKASPMEKPQAWSPALTMGWQMTTVALGGPRVRPVGCRPTTGGMNRFARQSMKKIEGAVRDTTAQLHVRSASPVVRARLLHHASFSWNLFTAVSQYLPPGVGRDLKTACQQRPQPICPSVGIPGSLRRAF